MLVLWLRYLYDIQIEHTSQSSAQMYQVDGTMVVLEVFHELCAIFNLLEVGFFAIFCYNLSSLIL